MVQRCAYFCRILAMSLVVAVVLASAQAHRSAAHSLDPSLQAFLAAGGSLADICDEDHGEHDAWAKLCVLCLPAPAVLHPGLHATLLNHRFPVVFGYFDTNQSVCSHDPANCLPRVRAPPV